MKINAVSLFLLAIQITFASNGEIIFSDDFETYPPGSNLTGQSGWTEARQSGASVLTVSPGNYLPSSVLNGRAATGQGQENYVAHSITINPRNITTMEFSAYAVSSSPRTHNQGVSFQPAAGAGGPGWYSSSFNGPLQWSFTVGTNLFWASGGFDQVVWMNIVVDGPAGEAFGTYDFGMGQLETPHFKISQEDIANLQNIVLYVDHREPSAYTGMEIDRLRVASSPPPGNVVVFASNFDLGTPMEMTGVLKAEPVGDLRDIGAGTNVFTGSYLANHTLSEATVLTLTNLPEHTAISLSFLLSILGSWDGSTPCCEPDIFNVTVDGLAILSESFTPNARNLGGKATKEQTFVPSPRVLVHDPIADVYAMGLESRFQNIPHNSSTLTVSWFANGAGWQGGDDEWWAIDNASVAITPVQAELSIRTSQVELCWRSTLNKMEQIQYRSTVTDTWTNLGSAILGTGAINRVTDSILPGQSERLYRLVTAP